MGHSRAIPWPSERHARPGRELTVGVYVGELASLHSYSVFSRPGFVILCPGETLQQPSAFCEL